MATIKNVSEKAGVSSATVSHVINGTRFVSQEVKSRVWSAIEALDYHPNYIARTLRMGKSNTIGLLVPNTRNPYFTEVAWDIEQVAYQQNYSVIICNTENQPEREQFYINVLLQKQVDGIVFITCGNYSESTKILAQSRIPFVLMDRESDDGGRNCAVVMTDERSGAEMATEYLCGLGHTRIACVTGGTNEQVTSEKRRQGYADVLLEHNIEVDEQLIKTGDFLMPSGYEAGLELLRMQDPPTAVFAFNDLMALGVLRAADECEYAVPGDLSVVGFDNIEMASYSIPTLTTIGQRKRELAESVFLLLMDMIKKETDKKSTIVLRPELIVRKTCAAPKVLAR